MIKKHNIISEFLVYTYVSVKYLLINGKWSVFVSDIMRFSFWRKTRKKSADNLLTHYPWLAFGAIDFLEQWLHKEMNVFEYGSGSSTLFFAKRVNSVISIDHNKDWFKNGEASKLKYHLHNVQYLLREPQPRQIESGQCNNPDLYLSCMGEYANYSFEQYVKSIDSFPDAYFDLVVVDGRARPSCLKHAVNKVKVNGILLLDNADRNYYTQYLPQLFHEDSWEIKIFKGHLPYNSASELDTTILFTKKK